MKKDILIDGMSINLGQLIEQDFESPINYHIPTDICNSIGDSTIKGKMSSYPIYKDGKCYPIEFEFKPEMGYCDWGGRKDYFCFLTDIIKPFAMRMKEEFDKMEEKTEKKDIPMLINECRSGENYECWHSIYDLYVEELILDTDDMSITMELGS